MITARFVSSLPYTDRTTSPSSCFSREEARHTGTAGDFFYGVSGRMYLTNLLQLVYRRLFVSHLE